MNLFISELPDIADLLLIIILAVWGLISDIKDTIEDQNEEIHKSKNTSHKQWRLYFKYLNNNSILFIFKYP